MVANKCRARVCITRVICIVRDSDAEVPLDEIKKHPVGHVSVEEASSQEVDTKSMHVAPNASEEELPKLPSVRLRSAESKVREAPKETFSGGIRKNGEALTPVNVAPAVESTTFGLGCYLDVPVGQDISSSGSQCMSATACPSGTTGNRLKTKSGFRLMKLIIPVRMNELALMLKTPRTGFEDDKDFPVVINAVIAGRYHVTKYLGSAAFNKAIQAHDLHT